jgi:hypothetical protein
MAMTMRNARRLLVLALGVAGLVLAAGAPGAGAVVLDCTGTVRWNFNPPLRTEHQTGMTVTYTEELTACTGDAVLFAASGRSTGTFTADGDCKHVFVQGTGSKRIDWSPSGFYSIFDYYLTGAGPSGTGEAFSLAGTFPTGLFSGTPPKNGTEDLWIDGPTSVRFMVSCSVNGPYSTLDGRAHLTIN